jgi:hypothetical protein
MKCSVIVAIALIVAAACHSNQPTIYANDVGLRVSGQPPLVRPARSVNSQLQSANRGRLVVHTAAGFTPAASSVILDGTGPGGAHIQRTFSAAGIAEFDDLEAGEYTATVRHLGLQPQALRLIIARGFADTVFFNLGQP